MARLRLQRITSTMAAMPPRSKPAPTTISTVSMVPVPLPASGTDVSMVPLPLPESGTESPALIAGGVIVRTV